MDKIIKNKIERLNVRLTKSDKKTLELLSKKHNLNMSETVLKAIKFLELYG